MVRPPLTQAEVAPSPEGESGSPEEDRQLRPETPNHLRGERRKRIEEEDLVLIKKITTGKSERGETLIIEADRPFRPTIFSLGGAKPSGQGRRIVVDIKNASLAGSKSSQIHVGAPIINKVRYHFHPDSRKVRVVLELSESKPVRTHQAFAEVQNTFSLELTSEAEELKPSDNERGQATRRAGGSNLDKEVMPAAAPVTIKEILFRKTPSGKECVMIRSDRFFKPQVFGLEKKNPFGENLRVVIDIKDAFYEKKGPSRMDVNGRMIKSIRTYFQPDSGTLRVVLDLLPSERYSTEQVFYEEENIYSLVVAEGDGGERVRTEHRDGEAREEEKESFPGSRAKESVNHMTTLKDESADGQPGIGAVPPEGLENEKRAGTPSSASDEGRGGNGEHFRLRSQPGDLNEMDVHTILKTYNFYSTCGSYNGDFCNPWGQFDNFFVNNGDGTITDRTTALMWQQGGSTMSMTWTDAKDYVAGLNEQNFAGCSDWRLPTLDELASLLEDSWRGKDLFLDEIFESQQMDCWTIDTHGSDKAWKVNFHLGYVIDSPCIHNHWVRAVRVAPSTGKYQ